VTEPESSLEVLEETYLVSRAYVVLKLRPSRLDFEQTAQPTLRFSILPRLERAARWRFARRDPGSVIAHLVQVKVGDTYGWDSEEQRWSLFAEPPTRWEVWLVFRGVRNPKPVDRAVVEQGLQIRPWRSHITVGRAVRLRGGGNGQNG
jgi:hypothetical protein